MLKKQISFLVIICIMLTLVGCGGKGNSSEVGETPSVLSSEPTSSQAVVQAPVLDINPLTGVRDMKTDNDRPFGCVVTDEDRYHVQIGIDKADMYFEAETEAGIPRILAIFSSIDRIPNEIGPVRSARPHFVKFADGIDAIYGHIGGSETGLDTIRKLGVAEIAAADQVNSILKNSPNHSWNRKTFVASKVKKEASQRKHRLTTNHDKLFVFGEKVGSMPATTIELKISYSYHMAFTYDSARGVYQKHRNSLSSPIHKAHGGGVIEVSNVIIMYDSRQIDPKDSDRCDYSLYSGSGIVASGGTAREIKWKRDNKGLHYYESDGVTPLTVSVGKTFVCLTSKSHKNSTKMS